MFLQDSVHSGQFQYRVGALSAANNYNENYNYAYQSTDSLNHSYSESGGVGGGTGGRRKGATLPMPPQSNAKIPKIAGLNGPGYHSQSLDLDDGTYRSTRGYASDRIRYRRLDTLRIAKNILYLIGNSLKSPMFTHDSIYSYPSSARHPTSHMDDTYTTSMFDEDYDDAELDDAIEYYDDEANESFYQHHPADDSPYDPPKRLPTQPTAKSHHQKLPEIPFSGSGKLLPTPATRLGGHTGTTAASATTYQPTGAFLTNGLMSTAATSLPGYSTKTTYTPSSPLVPPSTSSSSYAAASAPQQIIAGSITTFTKTLSSIFASKNPPQQQTTSGSSRPASASTTTGGLSFTAKFMQSNKPPVTATTTPASQSAQLNNYCDEDYYKSISGGGHHHLLNANSQHQSLVATTTLTSTTVTSTVDYSDDYKFNYDDYSYSETDYIATGDITNVKNHYNNNYPDYGCVAVEPRLIGDPDDDQAFSGGLGQTQHKHQQQQIDNISYSYCDSNGVQQVATSSSSTLAYKPVLLATTVAATVATATSTATSVAKSGGAMLLKQQQQSTVIYDEDEDDAYDDTFRPHDVDEEEEEEDEEDVEYMDDKLLGPAVSTITSTAADYYTQQPTPATSTVTAPYYNYQADCFNEEDEYRYLEEEQEQYRDDPEYYHEDDDTSYGPGFQHIHQPTTTMTTLATSASSNASSSMTTTTTTAAATKKKHLAAQDSIDDNEFFFKHSQNQLTINTSTLSAKHDVIREEDECQTPLSSGEYHPPSASPKLAAPAAVSSATSSATARSISATATTAAAAATGVSITPAPSLLLATTTATTSSSIIGGITASTAAAAMAAATSTMNHIADIGGGAAAATGTLATGAAAGASDKASEHLLLLDGGLGGPGAAAVSLLDHHHHPTEKKIGLGMAIGEMGMTVAGTTGMVGRKSEITAKQRWNWAYNKIIMQLNVSVSLFLTTFSRLYSVKYSLCARHIRFGSGVRQLCLSQILVTF